MSAVKIERDLITERQGDTPAGGFTLARYSQTDHGGWALSGVPDVEDPQGWVVDDGVDAEYHQAEADALRAYAGLIEHLIHDELDDRERARWQAEAERARADAQAVAEV